MPIRSLQGRLLLGLGIGLFALVSAIWVLGHMAMHRMTESFVLTHLQQDAEALVGALYVRTDGTLRIGDQRLTAVYNQPYSGHYFVLKPQGGKPVRSRSLWDWNLEVRQVAVGEHTVWHEEGPDGQQLLVWEGGFSKSGKSFSLAVTEDVAPLVGELQVFEWLLAVVALSGLALLGLLQRHFIRKTFRQLQPVYDDIARLESGEATALTDAVPAEVLPLVRKLNRVLELFRQRLERSRNATGNLAHALKGPMNLMGHLLRESGARCDDGIARALEEQIERIRRLTERELKRARFSGEGNPGSRFDPQEELPVLGELLRRSYPDKALDIQCRITVSGPLAADREDMLELLGNLLDNACKWADSRVFCTVRRQDGGSEFLVEDDGPGCSDQELEAIARRGVRLDENISGHGLGLAIVKDVVGLYGGRLDCGRSETLGGFRASVTLPLQSPDSA